MNGRGSSCHKSASGTTDGSYSGPSNNKLAHSIYAGTGLGNHCPFTLVKSKIEHVQIIDFKLTIIGF